MVRDVRCGHRSQQAILRKRSPNRQGQRHGHHGVEDGVYVVRVQAEERGWNLTQGISRVALRVEAEAVRGAVVDAGGTAVEAITPAVDAVAAHQIRHATGVAEQTLKLRLLP